MASSFVRTTNSFDAGPLSLCFVFIFFLLFSQTIQVPFSIFPHFATGSIYDIYSMQLHDVNRTSPSCIIDIMTSDKGKDRLNFVFKRYGYNHPLVQSGFFEFRIVYSANAQVKYFPDVVHLKCPCNDQLMGINGLVCRVNFAQKTFPQEARWHFRAMDDTFINLYQLWKQIYFLEQIYNPMTDIVFRAFTNWNWDPLPYVGGGCGWLASNAFVTHMGHEIPSLIQAYEFDDLKQDDTTMYNIISNMFDDPNQWSSPFYVDSHFPNDFRRNFNCSQFKDPPYLAFSEVVSLHVNPGSFNVQYLHKTGWELKASYYLFEKFDETRRYVVDHIHGHTIPCYASKDVQYPTLTLEFENRSYKLLRPEMFSGKKWKKRFFKMSKFGFSNYQ